MLGSGSRPNKSLIFVWSPLISHTVLPDINPVQAGAVESGDAHWPSRTKWEHKEEEKVLNSET